MCAHPFGMRAGALLRGFCCCRAGAPGLQILGHESFRICQGSWPPRAEPASGGASIWMVDGCGDICLSQPTCLAGAQEGRDPTDFWVLDRLAADKWPSLGDPAPHPLPRVPYIFLEERREGGGAASALGAFPRGRTPAESVLPPLPSLPQPTPPTPKSSATRHSFNDTLLSACSVPGTGTQKRGDKELKWVQYRRTDLETQNKGKQSLMMMCQDSGCKAYPAPGEDAGGRHAHVEVVHICLDFL